jgi:putative tryptophan/tyrosine transport system substrate-binding protein
MQRRDFIIGIVVSTAMPLAAHAQQPATALIGILGSGFPKSSAIFVDAFKQGMAENGLAEGRDYSLDARWAEGDYTRFAALAADLAQRKPKVILVSTISATRIAQQVAPTIPLVMAGLIDPVGAGLIVSLAQPGNNTTGLSNMAQDVTAKGLELLRIVVPTIKTVAVLFNPANPGNHLIMEDVRNKAAILGVTVRPIEFKGPDTLDTTIEAATGNDAFLMIGDAALIDLREPIAALTLRHRLPTVSSIPEFTDAGALIGYGPSRRAFYRRAATYVKKVLDGVKPSDLPVEQPTEIELSINLRAAKALGLVFPDTLIARANRVVE